MLNELKLAVEESPPWSACLLVNHFLQADPHYEATTSVKAQMKFLEELDSLERKRHEEVQRGVLLRAAKVDSTIPQLSDLFVFIVIHKDLNAGILIVLDMLCVVDFDVKFQKLHNRCCRFKVQKKQISVLVVTDGVFYRRINRSISMNLLWRPTSRALGRLKYNANTRISRCHS